MRIKTESAFNVKTQLIFDVHMKLTLPQIEKQAKQVKLVQNDKQEF